MRFEIPTVVIQDYSLLKCDSLDFHRGTEGKAVYSFKLGDYPENSINFYQTVRLNIPAGGDYLILYHNARFIQKISIFFKKNQEGRETKMQRDAL